ncbi:hypothetical protein V5E97_15455 [Singulisphaera sp. Ch08]|uniref:Uncharacterized protein n=1 Tax=Singulisphaera sp. Ch08 TaxID=3120278 RepID=A0AAU7CR26_9BACT
MSRVDAVVAQNEPQVGERAVVLSAGVFEIGDEGGVAELAGRIKALRAENTVEVEPVRADRKAATAEKPVTARILERMREVPPEEPVALEEPEKPEVIEVKKPVVMPAMDQEFAPSHAKRVVQRRQDGAGQMRLF